MKLVIVGTGYVGLVAGACFAEAGHHVVCVEKDLRKLEMLSQGMVYFYEPGLQDLVQKHYASGFLTFTQDLAEALPNAQVVFIAVGTPEGKNGEADLSYVYGVAREIGQHATHPLIVVDKSTVPVGTHERVAEIINQELDKRKIKLDIEVVSNPEFLRQGAAVKDFLYPDRVVIGAKSTKAFDVMVSVYESIAPRDKILCMDPYSAEMTKYAANAFLATKISFINEMSNLCSRIGADIDQVSKAIGMDHRITPLFLNAGIGYGGSCFPKDVKSLAHKASELGYRSQILESVDAVNQRQKRRLVELFAEALLENGLSAKGMRIAIWGLSFKPETDDMREAPSRVVIKHLLKMGCEVIAYDPVAMARAEEVLGDRITYASSANQALENSHALFLLTEWKEFCEITPEEIVDKLALPFILDGRNVFNPKEMKNVGAYYVSIGRPTVKPQQGINVHTAINWVAEK
ncbi:MAG: UDP-glucose dehydrogenase family protein [Desulfitobacteriaceae bacterium]